MYRCFVALVVFATTTVLWQSTPARGVSIETVIVGDPGNPADKIYPYNNPDNLQFGSVPYQYRIGKYEVTNAQYVAFLNAKAKSDPYLLFNPDMTANPAGGIIRNGVDGSYSYTLKPNFGNKPVNYISFNDGIRFVNWLNNGQGNGDTETGSYTIGEVYPGGYPVHPENISRNPGAKYFAPTENEWYKAAYYDPRSEAQGGPPGDDHYWLYTTRSDTLPTSATANNVGNISNPGANVVNHSLGADWNGQDGNVTTVGSAGPLSASYYGTYDQGGNVWEWNEQLFGVGRGLRGGGWNVNAYNTSADLRNIAKIATGSYPGIGFRIGMKLIPGDANGDMYVEGADYSQWADHFLEKNVGFANGDFSQNGIVDAGDYTLWADNYFPSSPFTSAVPEPASLALMVIGVLALYRFAHRIRRVEQGRQVGGSG